ncbi:DNA primase large subunit-like [Chelonus insularis]|uniref:DNA primase large subunit-like n=1 Tax=Chelonus insularis TaxID=460826 RepID=UPI00158A78AF|nr:DNA primase large subunit-like [Chelonus insularis]
MECNIKRRRRGHYVVEKENNNYQELYPHDISMYTEYPKHTVQLHHFFELGLERRQILKLVELVLNRSDLKTVEERKLALKSALRRDGYNYAAKLLTGAGCTSHTDMELEARKRDVLSHFILRLAYSQSPDYKKWFIVMEVEYMKLRITSLNNEGMAKLLAINNFTYHPISQEEKDELREELNASTAKMSLIDNTDFYKVPFTKVLDLVRARKVYLKKGMAYTPQSELSTLFISQYKRHLTKAIEVVTSCFYDLQGDERIFEYLKNLPSYFPEADRTIWSTTETSIDGLDDLSRTSYPLCMRTLHEALRINHHLKNSGRVQYALFLKGIGVKLEDSLHFWRAEFTKKIDGEKFEKQYAYTIRFLYGKTGSQRNYTPMGCTKIINSIAGAGEYHGCPYRLMDNDTLKKKLTSYGIQATDVNEIAGLAKEHHYQLACAKYFEVTHKTPPENPVMHPNAYFSDSQNIIAKITGVSSADTNESYVASGTPKHKSEIKSERYSAVRTPNRTPSRTPTARRSIKVEVTDIEKMLNDDEME